MISLWDPSASFRPSQSRARAQTRALKSFSVMFLPSSSEAVPEAPPEQVPDLLKVGHPAVRHPRLLSSPHARKAARAAAPGPRRSAIRSVVSCCCLHVCCVMRRIPSIIFAGLVYNVVFNDFPSVQQVGKNTNDSPVKI